MAANGLPFEKVLANAGVPIAFIEWLTTCTVTTRADFLIAARSDAAFVDSELIDQCGLNLGLAAKTNRWRGPCRLVLPAQLPLG